MAASATSPATSPPYELPANMTQTGIKTRSTKDGGTENFNEIRFEDKKGSEQLFIHAEKNQDSKNIDHNESVTVGNDRTKSVGNNETINIGTNRNESVEKNETISISANRSESVGGNETVTVGQDRSVTIGNNDALDLGPFLAALAAHALAGGYRPSPCLVYASSDLGDRAALLLNTPAG